MSDNSVTIKLLGETEFPGKIHNAALHLVHGGMLVASQAFSKAMAHELILCRSVMSDEQKAEVERLMRP